MKVYNIGAEGQLFAGAIAASGWRSPCPSGLPRAGDADRGRRSAAPLAGALWAQLAAIPKAVFGTDEIITTLMLNFIALGLMNYLIQGSRSFWRNPTHPVPQGKEIPESAQLPDVSERLHAGFFIAIARRGRRLVWRCARRRGASGSARSVTRRGRHATPASASGR